MDKVFKSLFIVMISFMLLTGCSSTDSFDNSNLKLSSAGDSQDILRVLEEKRETLNREREMRLQAAKIKEEQKKESASQTSKENSSTAASQPQKKAEAAQKTASKKESDIKTSEAQKTTTITTKIVQKTATQKIVNKTGVPEIPFNFSYTFFNEIEMDILNYVNQERAKEGLDPLIWEDKLRDTAEYKANEMLQYEYFAHTSPVTGGPMNLAVDYFKYETNGFGENLLYYYSSGHNMASAERMVQDWMNSPPHRANILRPEWKKLGAGVVYSSDKNYTYAVQHFSE